MSIKKTGSTFYVQVSSGQREFDADGFKTVIRNLATGDSDTLVVDGTEEVEQIVDAKTSTTGAIATAGERTISISAGGELLDGMIFDDGSGNKYYIESITADTIFLKKSLVADIAFGITLTEVGNTGIYSIPVTIAVAGIYGVRVSNPSLNMNIKEIQIGVEDVVMSDLNATMSSNYANINAKLDIIKETVDTQSEALFEVYSS